MTSSSPANWPTTATARRRPPGVRGSLDALGFDYLDLFLIHWPLPTRYDGDYVSTWQALEEFYRDGRARSIGVSNFQPHHLRRLHTECEITPAADQIEVNPYLTQARCGSSAPEHQIAIEAWSPLAQRRRTAPQPVHRLDRRGGQARPGPGRAALAHPAGRDRLPQVGHRARIRENIDIFDFELSGEDIETISALNRDERTGPDPDKFDGV